MDFEIDWFNTFILILGIIALIFTIPIRNYLMSIMPELLKSTGILPVLAIYFGCFLIALVILLILSLIGIFILVIIQEISKGNFFLFKITHEKRRRK